MQQTTDRAIACRPSDSLVGAGGGPIHAAECRSGDGLRLSLNAEYCGSEFFQNFPVAIPARLHRSTDLQALSMPSINGLMAFEDNTLGGLDYAIGRRPRGSGPGYDYGTTLSRSNTMAFVNENIPEADLQRIDFASVMHPLHFCPIDTPSQWTIDRERDIALISLGGGLGENSMYPSFFLIYWQGQFTDVHLVASTTGNFPTWDLEVTWTLRFLRQLDGVPEALYLETLKEALTSFGYINSMYRDRVKAVKFNFENNITIRG
jgi:hypothetical protein